MSDRNFLYFPQSNPPNPLHSLSHCLGSESKFILLSWKSYNIDYSSFNLPAFSSSSFLLHYLQQLFKQVQKFLSILKKKKKENLPLKTLPWKHSLENPSLEKTWFFHLLSATLWHSCWCTVFLTLKCLVFLREGSLLSSLIISYSFHKWPSHPWLLYPLINWHISSTNFWY